MDTHQMNIGVLFSSKFLPTEMTLSVSVLLEVGLKLVLAFKGFPAVLPVTLEVRAMNSRNVPPKAGQTKELRGLADVTRVNLGSLRRSLSFGRSSGLPRLALILFSLVGVLRGLVAVMRTDMMGKILLVGKSPLTSLAFESLPILMSFLMSLSELDGIEHDTTI